MLCGMSDQGPVLLCFDGSEDAERAIHGASALLGPRPAVVLAVWERARDLTPLDPVGDAVGRLSGLYAELDEAGIEAAGEVAREGAELAGKLLLDARPRVECGPVPETIVRVAEEENAAVIVLGARGLSGMEAALGSVSRRVARHATRPVLVLPPESGGHPAGTGSSPTTPRTA
jgi:nucleotide-binding universal stress UspA family protein